MKYPISIQTFEKIIEGGYVYFDKTDLIYDLTKGNVCFLSRPRRFGKSLLISTLEAYFKGRKELFAGLKIEKLEKVWDVYPVFRIDFAANDFTKENSLEQVLEGYVKDWEDIYGRNRNKESLGDRFCYVLEQSYKQTGKRAVVLIDEYDRPLLDALGTEQEAANRETLKGFYGTFKAADASIRFALLTGVTKFSQITVFSGFNQPNDISMDPHYDALCGITEEELNLVLADEIRKMAEINEVSEQEMKDELKRHYDGYHFSSRMLDIYNPFSIINAFDKMELRDYWYSSGTPTYLAKLIEGHCINMQKLLEREYEPATFLDYKADVERPLPMLYQAGYLTIKGYDKRYGVFALDYPNEEVRKGFSALIANGYFKDSHEPIDNWALNLTRMYERGDLDGIRSAYTSFLSSIPYEANKDVRALDFETHYQYTFYIINRILSCYTILIEKQNSKGRADIIIETTNNVYIFEFKLDGTADQALEQIERQQYALPYLSDPRTVHKIGVNISSNSRTVDEWKCVN